MRIFRMVPFYFNHLREVVVARIILDVREQY